MGIELFGGEFLSGRKACNGRNAQQGKNGRMAKRVLWRALTISPNLVRHASRDIAIENRAIEGDGVEAALYPVGSEGLNSSFD